MSLVNGEVSDDHNVDFANELMAFATAVASRDEAELVVRRDELLAAANAEVVVDAAGVAGNFQRMVRIADAIGIPLDEDRVEMMSFAVDQLELRRFRSSQNTPLQGR